MASSVAIRRGLGQFLPADASAWIFSGPASLLLGLVIWEALGRSLQLLFLPPPSSVAQRLAEFVGAGSVLSAIADSLGNLIVGLAIYALASFACVVAGSFEALLAARVLQGAANAAPRVAAIAVIRDIYGGRRMAEVMSFIMMVFIVVPVIAPVQKLPGLIVATGFSGHGFGIGPGAGQLAADLATGTTPLVDPGPFRFERFSDGTRAAVYG